MNKKLRKKYGHSPEINLVSSLTLEKLTDTIAGLKGKHIQVDIESSAFDRVVFNLHYHRDGAETAMMKGILNRRDDHSTHVVADGIIYSAPRKIHPL